MANGSFRYLGNIAASPTHSVLLSCSHCQVSWGGCAAESFCPECHAPKGYYPHDLDDCYCHQCMPELAEALATPAAREGGERG